MWNEIVGGVLGLAGSLATSLSKPTTSYSSSLSPLGQLAFLYNAKDAFNNEPKLVKTAGEGATKPIDTYGRMGNPQTQFFDSVQLPSLLRRQSYNDSTIQGNKSHSDIANLMNNRYNETNRDTMNMANNDFKYNESMLHTLLNRNDLDRQLAYSNQVKQLQMDPLEMQAGTYIRQAPQDPMYIASRGLAMGGALSSDMNNIYNSYMRGYNSSIAGAESSANAGMG